MLTAVALASRRAKSKFKSKAQARITKHQATHEDGDDQFDRDDSGDDIYESDAYSPTGSDSSVYDRDTCRGLPK